MFDPLHSKRTEKQAHLQITFYTHQLAGAEEAEW